jgi:hypothetical protein
VVDGDEHRRLALAGHDRGQVAAPHEVDLIGGDPAVVGSRATRATGALVGQQAVLAHQAQDPAPAGADAGKAQPGPELAVALAVERAVGQELPDHSRQVLVRHRAQRPGLSAVGCIRSVTMAVDGRPRHAPDPRHPLQAVGLACGG